jgi:hypothetical protein
MPSLLRKWNFCLHAHGQCFRVLCISSWERVEEKKQMENEVKKTRGEKNFINKENHSKKQR